MSWHRLESNVVATWPTDSWLTRKVLVAVSGGPDSVAILRALLRIAGSTANLVVGHFNHRWRGVASDDDARFVRDLCLKLEVAYFEGEADLVCESVRTEEAARRSRYDFLTNTAYQIGARCVVTGHTADDRIETALHNLFRGSGLAGIAGPRVLRVLGDGLQLARPLLGTFRRDVLDYLSELGQDYRVDNSNADDRYSRNFLRNRLLPLARQHYVHGIDAQLLTFLEIARESIDALSDVASHWLAQQASAEAVPQVVTSQTGLERPWWVSQSSLREIPPPVLREALKHVWQTRQWPLQAMTRQHWKQTGVALLSDSGPVGQCKNLLSLPGNLRVVAFDGWRFIGPPHRENGKGNI